MKFTSPVGTLPEADVFVDEPFCQQQQLLDFGPVCEEASVRQASRSSSTCWIQPRKPPRRHIRVHVEFPFPTHRASLGSNPRFAPPLPWPGGVSHQPPCQAPPGAN